MIDIPILLDDLATLPAYAHEHDAGFDLSAAIAYPIVIYPGERKLIPTGCSMSIEPGFHVQIHSRSGLTLSHGIVVAQGVGIIDAPYRGIIKVILLNVSDKPYTIEPFTRIAQGILLPVAKANFHQVTSLVSTDRGEGGFGSTGLDAYQTASSRTALGITSVCTVASVGNYSLRR